MEKRGQLRSWNDEKGFGFIRPEQGSEGIFAHISAMRGTRRPAQGDRVFYISGRNNDGRLRATHIRLDEGLSLDEPAIRRKPSAVAIRPAQGKSLETRAKSNVRPRRKGRSSGRYPSCWGLSWSVCYRRSVFSVWRGRGVTGRSALISGVACWLLDSIYTTSAAHCAAAGVYPSPACI